MPSTRLHQRLHRPFQWMLAVLLLAGSTVAIAEVTVEGAWSRATPPGHPTGAAYFQITNHSTRGDQLIGVTTDRAPRVELHQTIEEGGNARMVHTPQVRLPAGETLSFEPGGRHVMLMGLTEALAEGEVYEITLQLEQAGDLTFQVEVRAATAMGGSHNHGGMGH